jgi:hypothetical protein
MIRRRQHPGRRHVDLDENVVSALPDDDDDVDLVVDLVVVSICNSVSTVKSVAIFTKKQTLRGQQGQQKHGRFHRRHVRQGRDTLVIHKQIVGPFEKSSSKAQILPYRYHHLHAFLVKKGQVLKSSRPIMSHTASGCGLMTATFDPGCHGGYRSRGADAGTNRPARRSPRQG